jgi:phosphate-selective porin OprO/OprP
MLNDGHILALKRGRRVLSRGRRLAIWVGFLLLMVTQALASDDAEPHASASEAEPAQEPEPVSDPEPAPSPEGQEALKDEVLEWEETAEEVRRRLPFGIQPDKWTVERKNGFHLFRNDKRYDLLLGGQLMVDGGAFFLERGLTLGSSGWHSKVALRRARLFAQGIAFDRFYFKASFEFEDSDVKDLFVGVKEVGPLAGIQLGYMKQPFSLEASTSLMNSTFMERSLASVLAPERNPGLLVTDWASERRLRWALGVFREDDTFGDEGDGTDGQGVDGDWEISLRVSGLPIQDEEAKRSLIVGASYNHVFGSRREGRLKKRPESFLVDQLVDTGAIAEVRGVDRFGVEAAWIEGPLRLQGEWVGAGTERGSAHSDLFFWGSYLQASYFLTGERRIYGRRTGVFGRVIPHNAFEPSAGRWGAFEVAARVSYLTLNDHDLRGGIETGAGRCQWWSEPIGSQTW